MAEPQGSGLEQLLAQLGGGPNPWAMAGAQGAGMLFGGIADLLRGESPGEKRSKETFGLLKNRLGQDVLQPEQYLADYMRSLAPQFNRQAEGVNKRLGLDSGVAQGQMAANQQSTISSFMFNAKMRNDELKSRNDSLLMSIMAQLSGR